MFSLGYILIVIAKIIHTVLSIYQFIVLAAVIMSWIRPNPSHEVIRTIIIAINRLTEPVFFQVRKRLPRSFFPGGLDFTPIIVLLALYFIDMLFSGLLMDIGFRLRMGAVTAPPMDTFQPM